MDLDKIINSIYDIEKDCKCDYCKKAIKNRKWLKRKFKEYYKSEVKNLNIDDVIVPKGTLPFEFVEWYSGMNPDKIKNAYNRWQSKE